MFIHGKKNGKGKEYICEYEERGYDDKDWYTYLIYDGNYQNDKKNGKGKKYHYGKLVFEGEYLNGDKWKGKEYYKGELIFEGEYLNGKKWKGLSKNGVYKEGKLILDGKFKKYYINGKLSFEGEYKNGKLLNGKIYDDNGKILNKKWEWKSKRIS